MIKKTLSNIRYLLWIISGSEISILKECKTDYNRHANIGLAIFVTTLIAVFAGSLAGFEFGNHKFGTAILFGLLWGLMVFTIDRNMVLTLKKDPSKTRQKLLLPILYRMFLSALIAFFIAIPLELWIFKENIKKQIRIDNDAEIIHQRKVETEKFGIEDLKSDLDSYNYQSSRLDSILGEEEPALNYQNYTGVKNEMNTAYQEYTLFLREFNRIVKYRKSLWEQVPEYQDTVLNRIVKDKKTTEYYDWYKLWKQTKPGNGKMTIQLNGKNQTYNKLKEKVNSIKSEYFKKRTNEKNNYDSLLYIASNKLALNKNSIEIKKASYEKFIDSFDGFIIQWTALNNIKNGWLIFFIWFIRLVFFVIEMLPTLAKVTTPVGSYDWAVYYTEINKKSFLESNRKLREKIEEIKSETEIEIYKRKEKQRIEHDLILQKELLALISAKQIDITLEVLDDWEKKHKENVRKEIESVVKNFSAGND